MYVLLKMFVFNLLMLKDDTKKAVWISSGSPCQKIHNKQSVPVNGLCVS